MRKPLILLLGALVVLVNSSQNINVDDITFEDKPSRDSSSSWYGNVVKRLKRDLFSFFGGDESTEASEETTTTSPSTIHPTTSARETRSPDDEDINSHYTGYTPDDEDGKVDNSGSGETESIIPPLIEDDDLSKTLYRMTILVEEPWDPEYQTKTKEKFRRFAEDFKQDIDELFQDVHGEQTSDVIKMDKIDATYILVTVDLGSVGNSNTKQLEDRIRNQINTFNRIGNYIIKSERFTFQRFKDCEDSGQMRCTKSNLCIPLSSRCDGTPQCPDYEDEEGCDSDGQYGHHRPDPGYTLIGEGLGGPDLPIIGSTATETHHCRGDAVATSCSSNSSVKICSNQFCDKKPDCPDKEDEENCPGDPGCLESEFTCDLSRCIPPTSVCDGIPDCSDGTDEHNNCPVTDCDSTQFRCADKCLPISLRCNKVIDCADGADEANCPGCQVSEWQCNDGSCIPSDRQCNMQFDCLDHSDEINCRCRDDQFSCGDHGCIHKTQVCNKIPECPDGRDERDCPSECLSNEFRCRNGVCINSDYVCDDIHDCTDKSDEEDCANRSCGPNDFRCQDNNCINIAKKCDGTVDCSDGGDEDELICRPTCQSHEWQCNNGECIPLERRCDGRTDCADSSDETNNECPAPTTLQPRIYCRSWEFKCFNNRDCIPQSQHCDGRRDCPDNSDEIQCDSPAPTTYAPYYPPQRTCGSWEFKCWQNGECIPKEKHCNNERDCPDGSDEENCAGIPHPNLKVYERDQIIKESREAVFRCRDEGPGRYKVKWSREGGLPLPPGSRVIDGRLEMPNIQREHSGVYYCEAVGIPSSTFGARVSTHLTVEQLVLPTHPFEKACGPNEATCYNRECILKSEVCDGVYNCADGSDESRCKNAYLCEPNEFQCANKRCVLKTWRCDGDDDCGDNSDELGCEIRRPGSQCYETEYECKSRNQCIPKSYQCDGTNDCQDHSDEVGCRQIVIESHLLPPKYEVPRGGTLVLTCRAQGVPIPEISWRKDWRHVPPKCTQSSINGTGTLTCPNFQREDCGAYTCEAVNSVTFVISQRDTIACIPSEPLSCPRGTFNDLASSPEQCIKCFCFGVPSNCRSADLYIYQLPPPLDIFRLINVSITPDRPDRRMTIDIRRNEVSYLQRTHTHTDGFSTQSSHQPYDYNYPYYALSDKYHGNQLKSYGGYLSYTVLAETRRGQQNSIPDIIITGNNQTLIYRHPHDLGDNVETKISAQIFENGHWYLLSGQGELVRARREYIMMALVDVDNILIRTLYVDGQGVTRISGITLDSAQYLNTEQGKAAFVEQCDCPAGYSGLSCERCANDYTRTPSSLWLGECKKLFPPCPRGYFGDPSRGIACEKCPCPLTTPPNQFTEECYLDSDNSPTCSCPAGYGGRRCEFCLRGYTGNPLEPGRRCIPTPECDPRGSYNRNEPCECKANVVGPYCSECAENAFHLSDMNQHGCINCFCMGVTKQCRPSGLYRDRIVAEFPRDSQGFGLAPEDDIQNTVPVRLEQNALAYDNFQPKVYYWILSQRFLGNRLPSYGGSLTFNLRYVSTPGGLSSRNNAAVVKLFSRDSINLYYYQNVTVEPDRYQTVSVPLLEQYWQRDDGGIVDREYLLMALANVEAIYIKATYTTTTQFASLQHVYLDTGTSSNTGRNQAREVEECDCPPGYMGLSCESCSAGYKRSNEGVYLGLCERCECNGRSEECHPESGECFNCLDNWSGPRCDTCPTGYIERGGRCESEGCYCDPRGTTSASCRDGRCDCKVNVEGSSCDRCKHGTFNMSAENVFGCVECFCTDVTQTCQSSNLYYEPFPMQILDASSSNGFVLTDRRGQVVVQDRFILEPSRNEIGYTFNNNQNDLFWSLPSQFTGDKITSYGGNLIFTRRFSFSRFAYIDSDYDVILNGIGKSVYWQNPDYPRSNHTDIVDNVVIPLMEGHWRSADPRTGHSFARRRDILEILSHLSSILIRASAGPDTMASYLSDVELDIAISKRVGRPAYGVEVCSCPSEYKGTSCQQCHDRYYRDYDNKCKRCDCNNNEESCSLGSNNELHCVCQPDYFGKNCEQKRPEYPGPQPPFPEPVPQIHITIGDPESSIQIKAVGSTVRYKCYGISRTGSEQIRLTWSKSGGELPGRAHDDSLGNLTIYDVKVSDSGHYICTAFDGITTHTEVVVLKVGDVDSPPVVHISPHRVEAYEGEYIEINCRGTGSPSPSLEWQRLGNRTFSSHTQANGGYLRINYVTKSDEGTYKCVGRNPAGSISNTIDVKVHDSVPPPPPGPSVYITPDTVSTAIGEPVTLECGGGYPSDVEVEWSRDDGRRLYSAQKEGSKLVFTRARPEDSGIYLCIIRSRSTGRVIGRAQASITISGGESPYPTITPDQQRVPQGLTAEFTCNVPYDSSSSQNNVRWFKTNGVLSSRAEFINNGRILRIRNLAIEDRGIYVCYSVYRGKSSNVSAMLEVDRRERPRIELYPADSPQILSVGNSLLLQCRVRGIPTPVIRWSKADNSILPHNIVTASSGTLRFNQVRLSDAGQYICSAENEAGREEASTHIEVRAPPEIRVFPKDTLHLVAGENLDLTCIADGSPTPTVQWTRHDPSDSNAYTSKDVIAEGIGRAEYKVFKVSREDTRVYYCVAQNADVNRRDVKFVQVYVDDFRSPDPQPQGNDDFWVPTGGDTQITCALESNRNLERQWVRADRNPFPSGVTQRDGTLYIRSATPAVQGEYICQLFDEQGRVQRKIGKFVSVKELPEISLHPPRQTVRPGENAEIRCSARGEEPIEITWESTRPLPPSVTVSGGLLSFRGITESDAGRYVCKARNIAGLREAAADVIVNDNAVSRPRVSIAGERSRTAVQGSTVTLRCSASDYSTHDMGWSRSEGALPSSTIIEGDTIRIGNIQPYHSGRYICSLRTPSGATGSDYVDLTVTRDKSCPGGFQCRSGECIHESQECDRYTNCADGSDEYYCSDRSRRGAVHIRLKIEPSIDIIRVGSTVDLRCITEGIPSSQLEWTKLGEDSLGPNVQTISASVLRIADVTTSNAGPYRCSAQTESGTYTDDYILNVQDNSLSDSSSSPATKTILLKVGDTSDISCTNDLEPPVSYKWVRHGGLPSNAAVEEDKLTISQVTSKDAGLYTCEATNGEVKMEIPTFVVVKGAIPKFSSQSYVKLKTLFDAYMKFDVELLFKPEDPNGLILYNGRQPSSTGGSDFVSFGLRNGYPEFRFDMGSGHATIVGRSPLPIGKWAKAKLTRNRKEGQLIINDEDPVIGTSQGRHQGLDLDLPLYLGSVPDFGEISKSAEFNNGFKGCISKLVVKNEEQNLTQTGVVDWVGIEECDTCSGNSCTNSGACQEAANAKGYVCLCPKGFSGEHCDRTGESCYAGLCGDGYCENTQRGYVCKCPLGLIGSNCEHRIKISSPSFEDSSYIAYSAPRDTGKIDITLKMNPADSRDALILYAAQNDFGTGNYMSISIKDRKLEYRIDTGSGSPMVLKSNTEIIPGTWMTINAGRDTREARLSIGHDIARTTLTSGQRKELLLGTFLYLGGFDTSTGSVNPSVGVTDGFRGCISHIEISRMDLDILKSAKESSNVDECPSGNPCRDIPCRNGATCLPEGSKYTCQCTPDYIGQNCEKLKNDCEKYEPCGKKGACFPHHNGYKCHCAKGFSGQNCTIREHITTSFSMEGDGWVELPKDMLADIGDETELELNIVTDAPNGILVWHGQGPAMSNGNTDFFSVALVDGYVEVVFELGSGLGTVVSENRMNDGQPHRILVTRSGNIATLAVDGRTTNGQSDGILSALNANGNIYIGGVPDPSYMTNGRYLENFNGCIRNIRIQNSDVLDVSNSAISTVNLRRCPVSSAK